MINLRWLFATTCMCLALALGAVLFVDAGHRSTERDWNAPFVRDSFSIFVEDEDIDASAQTISSATDLVQMDGNDFIEIVSAEAADTGQRLRIYGVGVDSTRTMTIMRLNGTTVVAGTDSFFAFTHAEIDSGGEATGIITIRNAGDDAAIVTIPIGELTAGGAHVFSCKRETTYITQIKAQVTTGTGTILGRLRIYKDFTDATRDPTDGFDVEDAFFLAAGAGLPYVYTPVQPILVPRYGAAVLYATGGAANSDLAVTIQGYHGR